MKRILIFSLAYYPRHVSGAEGAIKEITDRIAPQDIEFHMVTLRFSLEDMPRERLGNVEVHRVGSGSYLGKALFPLQAALIARRLHRELSFDAVWAMMTYMTLPLMLSRFFGVRLPYVLTLQDGDPYEKVFGRLRILPFLPLVDRGFRDAAVIQVISTYLGTWPVRRGSRAPIELVHNGANPRDLKESVTSQEIEEAKRTLGKKEGDVYLVNTARLEHQKAQDDVIRALPFLPEHVKFLVVGGGTDEAMLKRLAAGLKLEERVIFTGQVPREVVSKYRNRHVGDIFVAPSRSEGLGNAFLSAMASKLPVIATQEGGLSEFVSPETAWVVPKDSPDHIAAAVKDILANPQKAERITQTARKMVEQNYDWDMIAKQMREKVFEKVL